MNTEQRGQHNPQGVRTKLSRSRARRREELMKSTVERRRQQVESERMELEDELSRRMEKYWQEQELARQAQKRGEIHGIDPLCLG